MKTDALNRRLRFAEPQPVDKRIDIQERDYLIFEALHRHGPLSTNYLFEFTKHLNRNFSAHQNRLTKLYNGAEEGGGYLTRPPQQFASFEARYQPIIYDITPKAKRLLAERGTLARYSPERGDHFLHRFMGACVSASIELTAKQKGIRFIPMEEIFTHPKCPPETRRAANPLALPVSGFEKKAIVPDNLFGFEYPGGGFRFFAVEIDRNTESIERRKTDQNTFAKKIQGYFDILRNKTFKERWGLPSLIVLTVSTNVRHVENIIDHIAKQGEPKLAERFLFKAEPMFGTNWKVPRELLTELLDPWAREGETFDITKA